MSYQNDMHDDPYHDEMDSGSYEGMDVGETQDMPEINAIAQGSNQRGNLIFWISTGVFILFAGLFGWMQFAPPAKQQQASAPAISMGTLGTTAAPTTPAPSVSTSTPPDSGMGVTALTPNNDFGTVPPLADAPPGGQLPFPSDPAATPSVPPALTATTPPDTSPTMATNPLASAPEAPAPNPVAAAPTSEMVNNSTGDWPNAAPVSPAPLTAAPVEANAGAPAPASTPPATAEATGTTELAARLDMLSARLDALDSKLQSLEGQSGNSTSGNDGDLGDRVSTLEKRLSRLNQPTATKPARKSTATKTPVIASKTAAKSLTAPASASATASANWVLRSARPGEAWVSLGTNPDLRRVQVGETLPGIGKIQTITLANGVWVVQGSQGKITQ